MGNRRNVGVDLLRIFLALMVISIHFNATATGHVSSSVTWMPMKFLVYGTDALVLPAVNIYVIISGFFSFLLLRSYKKVLYSMFKLWFCMVFFSVGGAILVGLVHPGSINLFDLLQRCFPITTGIWWYMCVYFATMAISPFLNNAVQMMSKKASFAFLAAILLFGSIIPFFNKWQEYLGFNFGYSFIWFITLYYTGAIMCKYFSKIKARKNRYFLYAYIILAVFNVAFSNFTSKIEILYGYSFTKYNSVVLYVQAILIFYYFKNLKIESQKAIKIISYISGLSLAAYIFHCQTDISKAIWETINPSQYANSLVLIPVFVLTVLSIFAISIIIEIIRRKVLSINDMENRMIRWAVNRVQNAANGLYVKFDAIGNNNETELSNPSR